MPPKITLLVTTRCDLRCAHCLQGLPDKRADIPVDLVAQILEEARPFGAKQVGLTGGEPCLHPEFDRLVDTIVAAGYEWSFMSNGRRALPCVRAVMRHREAFINATLSIDGADAETHDGIRGKPGTFERMLAAAEHYVKLGFRLRMQTSFNQRNKHQLEDIARLVADISAQSYGLAGTIPTPWNVDLRLSDEERNDLHERGMALRDELDTITIKTTSSLWTGGGVDFCRMLNLRALTFNPRGEMVFCCDTLEYGAVIGSALTEPLPDLIERRIDISAALKKRRLAMIVSGEITPGFDTCTFCNHYLDEDILLSG